MDDTKYAYVMIGLLVAFTIALALQDEDASTEGSMKLEMIDIYK